MPGTFRDLNYKSQKVMRTALPKILLLTAFGALLMASSDSLPHTPGLAGPASTEPGGTPTQCSIRNTTFQAGEEIVYKIYYNWNFVWLSAGEVVFQVNEVGNQYHISVHGRTYKAYEWFFRVNDRYDTFIDKETLLPSLSIRDVEEGSYRLYDKVEFDSRRNIARSLRGDTREEAELTEYAVESCMHDILSIIYFTRNIDFQHMKEGESIPVKIFMDKETWPLKVKFKGRNESTKIRNLGDFRTIQFSPEVISGNIFEEGTEMNVWVSDDKNRVPLLIESPVSVGSVKAVLKEYKGLRHKMEAARE